MVTEVYIPEGIDRLEFCRMVKNKASRCGIGYYSMSNSSFETFHKNDKKLHIRPCHTSGFASANTVGFELMKFGDKRIFYSEFKEFVNMLTKMECFQNEPPTIALF